MSQSTPTETVEPIAVADLLEPGDVVAERYEVGRVLGRGGYGVVYQARDLCLRHDVALKVLRTDRLEARARTRFRREARVARQVICPQLLRVHDIGTDGDTTYLTMEIVHGHSLKDRLRDGPLEIREALRIVSEVLRGLAALHHHGVVHRDVKPANVLLSTDGAVRLADFGLARHFVDDDESRITRTNALVGTIAYLAPEQALGHEATPASDLYAVGVVLYECLTGTLPYKSASSTAALLHHVHSEPAALLSTRRDVPAWLEVVVQLLLEKNPNRRYPSAEAALEAIERPANAAPSRSQGRLVQFLRRRWLVSTLVVLGSAFLSVYLLRPQPGQPVIRYAKNSRYLEARSHDGKLLWKHRGTTNEFIEARLARDAPPRILAPLDDEKTLLQEDWRRISVIDRSSGEILDEIVFDDEPYFFPSMGFSNYYHPRFGEDDLDGDGVDEILITYAHKHQWPSFTILYEPQIKDFRVILAAAGHHLYAGRADLDGDGHEELLFLGPNNRMGYKDAVAALSVRVPAAGDDFSTASTAGHPLPGPQNLLWYVLLRRRTKRSNLQVHKSSRTIEIGYLDGTSDTIGFDGFLRDSRITPRVSRDERQGRRRDAYRNLEESRGFLAAGTPRPAVERAQVAVAAARDAGDSVLLDIAMRFEAEALAANDDVTQSLEVYHVLREIEVDLADLFFDAATAMHTVGYLEIALDFYKESLQHPTTGRNPQTRLMGAVEALSELERWEEACQLVIDSTRINVDKFSIETMENYIAWQTGEPLSPQVGGADPLDLSDPVRHLLLEFEYSRGRDVEALLKDVEAEMERTSEENRALVRSLEAQLLADSDRLDEALLEARDAFKSNLSDREIYPGARAHAGLVTRRYAELARRSGRDNEAKNAEAEHARWSQRQADRRSYRPANHPGRIDTLDPQYRGQPDGPPTAH